MNRKTIIACIAVLAGLAAIVAVAVFFLYSGAEETKSASLASESRTGLLSAVPSDAVMVVGFSDFRTACSLLTDTSGCFHYFTGGLESSALQRFLAKVQADGPLRSSRSVLSLHYNGSLVPLMAIDAGRAGAETDGWVRGFMAEADSAGLSVSLLDCSGLADVKTYLHRRNILLLSTSDVLTKSSARHIEKGISVLDSDGFAEMDHFFIFAGNLQHGAEDTGVFHGLVAAAHLLHEKDTGLLHPADIVGMVDAAHLIGFVILGMVLVVWYHMENPPCF